MDFEPGISDGYIPMDAKRLLQRVHTALNTQDLENLRLCFQPDYEQLQPANPGSEFTGASQLIEKWGKRFEKYPQFSADLLHSSIDGDLIWTEWHWHGDGPEDAELNETGVVLFGVEGGLIAWSRVYMQPIRLDIE
jgi:ketosteroid isomerase-like protein